MNRIIPFIPTCYCIGGIRIRLYVHAIIIFSLLSGLNSCETWKIDPVIEKWPMTTGSERHYQQTYYLFKFESDSSDVITDSDTIQNLYRIWVSKDTVLNDTLAVTVFELAEEDSLTWMWRQYYLLDEEGLIKRVVKIPRTYISDPNGEEIYSGQFAEVLQLVDVNIK